MDVLYKGGSLLYTQLSTVACMVASLPRYVYASIKQQEQQQSTAAGPHPGPVYYEGKFTHTRRRPVQNNFE